MRQDEGRVLNKPKRFLKSSFCALELSPVKLEWPDAYAWCAVWRTQSDFFSSFGGFGRV